MRAAIRALLNNPEPKRLRIAGFQPNDNTSSQSDCDDAVDIGRDVVYAGAAHASYLGRSLALGRVFANLIDNAIKYGDRAGHSQ